MKLARRFVCLVSVAVTLPFFVCAQDHNIVSGHDSVFVPLDSWIYPVLYRLAGMGYIPDQFSDMAPWTRDECARQIDEAAAIIQNRISAHEQTSADDEALKMVNELRAEINDKLDDDQNGLRLESIYTNVTGIKNPPLADSYHFGQTIVNNYGRPYWNGVNNDTGASGYANFGNFFVYMRGEYQYAPGQPNYSLPIRQFIAKADSNPVLPASGGGSISRIQPEEMYVGFQAGFENISFGRENMWWGPGQDSAMAFSDNADPFYQLNFDQTRPITLPWVFKYLGQMRTQFTFGMLSGHLFPRRPLTNAQKITFDITKDFEIGIMRSAFWGGYGHPTTFGKFFDSLLSPSSTGCTFRYGDRCDPGDRHTGLDVRWRLPGARKYVTVYTDSYADDEVNPLSDPKRSAWSPGIYISNLPHLSKMDFRVESYNTWLSVDYGGQFQYWNNDYHDSYTNDGFLLGSWIGRDARSVVGTTDYWFSGRKRLQVQVRQVSTSSKFLPGGGSQTDGSASLQWGFGDQLLASVTAQAERYDIPELGPARKDALVSVSIVFTPRDWVVH